jgi:CBS domain-containing protein
MKIKDVLTDKGSRGVETVYPGQRIDWILRLLDEQSIASVVVVDASHRPIGLVSDRELLKLVARKGVAALSMHATDAMITPAPSCSRETTITAAFHLMTDNRVRHLVVMDGTAMAGIVSIGDLVKYRHKDAELETRVLRDLALKRLAAE